MLAKHKAASTQKKNIPAKNGRGHVMLAHPPEGMPLSAITLSQSLRAATFFTLSILSPRALAELLFRISGPP